MSRTYLAIVTCLALVVACGGETEASDRAVTDRPGASSSGGNASAGGGGGGADEPATDDACSVARPGTAKALPSGLGVPAGAAGLTLRFQLLAKRVELTRLLAREVAPAWTSKDAQIFEPGTTSGAWVETRDDAGELTYQRNLFDPLGRRVEGAPDPNDPNGTWFNGEVCSERAEFSVDIPADAAEVRLYASERETSPTALIAWYRLR